MKERMQNVSCEGFRKGSGVPTALPAMGLQILKSLKGCGGRGTNVDRKQFTSTEQWWEQGRWCAEGRCSNLCRQEFVCTCKWRSEVNLMCQSSYATYLDFLRQSLSLAWSLPNRRGWLAAKPQGFAYLCPPHPHPISGPGIV